MESYYKQNKKLITDILDILEGHFGKNVEFVVHDLSLDYEHTIVDIRNGEVTGRKVGGTGDLLGLRALRYNGSNEGNCFNTLTYAENGKILRSSTLFFRNEQLCKCQGNGNSLFLHAGCGITVLQPFPRRISGCRDIGQKIFESSLF